MRYLGCTVSTLFRFGDVGDVPNSGGTALIQFCRGRVVQGSCRPCGFSSLFSLGLWKRKENWRMYDMGDTP